MQVSLTATGGLERRLEVAIPADRVVQEVEARLKQLSRTARLKGFRPGKAPLPVIRQQYGGQVHAEVVDDLIRSTFSEAVGKESLRPATGPRIEPLALEPGSDLRYAAVFEILPEVKLAPVDGLAIERATTSIAPADVDAMVESMRRQRPVFTEVARAARETDRVTIDFEGRIDGTVFEGGQGTDATFIVGSGRVMTEIDQGVRGAAAGEERSFDAQFPAEHPTASLAGKSARFTVKVKKVEEQGLPALDDEFCTSFGVNEGGVEALRAEVLKSMEREAEQAVRNRVRTAVMDALLAANPIEVPNGLVDDQVQEMQLDVGRRIGARDVSQLPPRDQFVESARRRVALGLLLGEVIRANGLKVDRERLNGRLNDLVAQYPNADEMRRAYLQDANAMRQLESAVLEDQAVDWIVERAKVTDKSYTFSELTGFGQNAGQNGGSQS